MTKQMLCAVTLGLALLAGSSDPLRAQESRSSSGDRLEGTVQKVDRENSMIIVAYEKVTRKVLYNKSTRFTEFNQPGSLDAVKEGRAVICRGNFDWRNRLVAYRVEVQDKE